MSLQSELLIDSRMEDVARARRWLTEGAGAEGFTEEEVRRLGLVISEACVNVIEHSYGGEPGNPIELSLVIDESSLVLTVRDVGLKFDVDGYQPPDLSVPHEGGYGVFLIRTLMDEVEYDTSAEKGTTLTLVKRRRAAS